MERSRIDGLLQPFTGTAMPPPRLLGELHLYLDLLLRWNARINLTSVREPEQIVTRHFGESLFAARLLLGEQNPDATNRSLTDIGSGAGFPGIPMKLFAPELDLTLIESNSKKATFLREVIRTLELDRVEVFSGRAEQWRQKSDLVTLRAVEQFERMLPVAANVVTADGRLCLLIGAGQVPAAQHILGADWMWKAPADTPQSAGRVVLVGSRR